MSNHSHELTRLEGMILRQNAEIAALGRLYDSLELRARQNEQALLELAAEVGEDAQARKGKVRSAGWS